MSKFVAALPMYDWPEVRGEIDAQWALLRDAFRSRGLDALEAVVRSNRDLPPVTGGVRSAADKVIAPDPA
ncbi:phosphate ABC transporter substrate-binding protein, partial [Mesorhizobium sp. M4B.F.Ca.ET.150.01.1.1]